jgi:hypothetical protein
MNFKDFLDQRCPTGGLRETAGPRPVITRPAKLFVTTCSFISFIQKYLKKIVIFI